MLNPSHMEKEWEVLLKEWQLITIMNIIPSRIHSYRPQHPDVRARQRTSTTQTISILIISRPSLTPIPTAIPFSKNKNFNNSSKDVYSKIGKGLLRSSNNSFLQIPLPSLLTNTWIFTSLLNNTSKCRAFRVKGSRRGRRKPLQRWEKRRSILTSNAIGWRSRLLPPINNN